MYFALLLVAFTVGLVAEPFIARNIKKRRDIRRSRRVGSAIVLLESHGYTVKWDPEDMSDWGEITSQIREDGRWA